MEIHRLEKKIDALITYCKDLENKNLFLESEQTALKKEKIFPSKTENEGKKGKNKISACEKNNQ